MANDDMIDVYRVDSIRVARIRTRPEDVALVIGSNDGAHEHVFVLPLSDLPQLAERLRLDAKILLE